MDIEKEFRALAAQHFALSFIVENVLSKLARDPALRTAIVEGFDQALDVAQSDDVQFADPTSPENSVKILRIIEETRVMVIDKTKPRSG